MQHPAECTPRQRVVFVIRAALMISAALLIGVPFLLGGVFALTLTAPGCVSGADPAAFGLPYEDIRFPLSEFNVDTDAYFIPADAGTNSDGRTVIAVPTGSAARGSRIDEIAIYQRAGFHVLTYSARGCVAPVTNSLGYLEVDAVGDALNYLSGRADVGQVGIHGFSMGGATAIMAAAQYPQIAAVVAQGGYHDFPAQVETNAPAHLPLGFGTLFRWGVGVGYRLSVGHDWSVLKPIAVIDSIDSPVLLLYGTNEPGLEGARLMQAGGGSNVKLWEIPGAVHGNYLSTAPEQYERRIAGFMNAALGR